MTQLADLVIVDYAAANQTFVVQNVDYATGVATWGLAGASYDASTLATFSLKIPSRASTRTRIKARIVIPIMDPVMTTKKIDECIAEVSFSLPKTATSVQRQNSRAFIRNFLSDNVIVNAVNTSQGVY